MPLEKPDSQRSSPDVLAPRTIADARMRETDYAACERVCVGAVLADRDGRVLLGRRSDLRAWLPGVWDVPGGHCEPGEAPEAALVREMVEELGVTPLAWTHLATAHDDGVTLHFYLVIRWRGTPWNAQPEEHDVLAWVSADDASRLELAHPGLCDVLRRDVHPPSQPPR